MYRGFKRQQGSWAYALKKGDFYFQWGRSFGVGRMLGIRSFVEDFVGTNIERADYKENKIEIFGKKIGLRRSRSVLNKNVAAVGSVLIC